MDESTEQVLSVCKSLPLEVDDVHNKLGGENGEFTGIGDSLHKLTLFLRDTW